MKAIVLLSVSFEIEVDPKCPISDAWYHVEEAQASIRDELDIYEKVEVSVSLLAESQEK